jgi:hypothetical protein
VWEQLCKQLTKAGGWCRGLAGLVGSGASRSASDYLGGDVRRGKSGAVGLHGSRLPRRGRRGEPLEQGPWSNNAARGALLRRRPRSNKQTTNKHQPRRVEASRRRQQRRRLLSAALSPGAVPPTAAPSTTPTQPPCPPPPPPPVLVWEVFKARHRQVGISVDSRGPCSSADSVFVTALLRRTSWSSYRMAFESHCPGSDARFRVTRPWQPTCNTRMHGLGTSKYVRAVPWLRASRKPPPGGLLGWFYVCNKQIGHKRN